MAEAGAAALKTGMDNECADFFTKVTDNSDYVKYLDAVKQGLLTEGEIDVALKRLFTARFRLGLFDPPDQVPYAQTPDSEIDSEAHRELALKMARESMVLLKNDGVLPVQRERQENCRFWASRPVRPRIGGQLQRHAFACDHGFGRNQEGVCFGRSHLRSGNEFFA